MFVQVIEGQCGDEVGLRRQFERWDDELRAGARGFLGVTAGVTKDGRAVALVRFASPEDAAANSERTEQASWWAETEKYYDGDVTFTDSTDVTEWRAGGSNDAGFVQVMKFGQADRATLEAMDAQIESTEARPDVIGGYRVWTGPVTCIEVAYFSSEKEARAGEKEGMPPELEAMMPTIEAMMAETEFLDLTDPHLR